MNHNPIGIDNRKVAMPATYNPVGEGPHGSCPAGCLQKDACYARFGNVNLHQKRSSMDFRMRIKAVEAAIFSAIMHDFPAIRPHVSGDFHCNGKVDWSYIDGVGELLARHPQIKAWAYTHEPDPVAVDVMRERLGPTMSLWHSDGQGPGSVTISDNPKRDGLTPCPAQLHDDMTCARCKLCWAGPAVRKVRLGFFPDGSGKKYAVLLSGAPRLPKVG